MPNAFVEACVACVQRWGATRRQRAQLGWVFRIVSAVAIMNMVSVGVVFGVAVALINPSMIIMMLMLGLTSTAAT